MTEGRGEGTWAVGEGDCGRLQTFGVKALLCR